MNNCKIVPATIKDIQYILNMHLIYIPESFFSTLGNRFLSIIYNELILSIHARTYIYLQNYQPVGYISFLVNRKKFFTQILKNKIFYIIFIIKIKNIFLIMKYFINTIVYLCHKNISKSELLFISVDKKYQNHKIASKLVDYAEQILKQERKNNVQVSINDTNFICQKMIKTKEYSFIKTNNLYGNQIYMYYKKL